MSGKQEQKGQKHREPVEARVPGTELHLVRDVLDKQMADGRSEPMGRVDGLVLIDSPGRPPRVTCLESGPTVLARRLHRRLGRWARAAARRWGVRRGKPVRIDWRKVKAVGLEVELDLDVHDTKALALEYWLREKFICRIPGASFKKGKPKKD